MNPNKTYIIEFLRDTPINALVHYFAPFTGRVDLSIPKGTRAVISGKMSIVDYYFDIMEETLPAGWLESTMDKIRSESRFPNRLMGRFSPHISVMQLLSSYIKFLPAGQYGDLVADNPGCAIKALRKQKCRNRRCARIEETEIFQQRVANGWCHYMLSSEERDLLLRRAYKKQ